MVVAEPNEELLGVVQAHADLVDQHGVLHELRSALQNYRLISYSINRVYLERFVGLDEELVDVRPHDVLVDHRARQRILEAAVDVAEEALVVALRAHDEDDAWAVAGLVALAAREDGQKLPVDGLKWLIPSGNKQDTL